MNTNICNKPEAINFGNIKIIGGETEWAKIVPTEETSVKETSVLRGFSTRILRGMIGELRGNMKVEQNIAKKAILKFKIKTIKEIINGRKPRFTHLEFEDIGVEYEIENLGNRSESMISYGIHNYEIKKGDIMRNKTEIREIVNEDGQKDYEIIYKNTPKTNNGELKIKDILALYYSKRLYVFKELLYKEDVLEEPLIIEDIMKMIRNPLVQVNVLIKHNNTPFYTPIENVKRKAFSTKDKSKDALSFLLNLKGDAIKVGNCKYYDEENEENEKNWTHLRAVGYNQLNYEDNHIVIMAQEETLTHIQNRVDKLHKEFESEKKYGKRVYELNGLTKNEESVLEKTRKDKFGFDESEIDELFEVLKEIDGRQSIRNIEFDIKGHHLFKYVFGKTSDELFFLKLALEDTPEYAEDVLDDLEYQAYMEVYGYLEKQMKAVTMKKVTALRNVISGLHLRFEDEEDLGRYMSEELDEIDKVGKERNFNFNRTHRNYYSQTEGVLVENGNPQKTHRRVSNPPSLRTLRGMRKHNRNVIRGEFAGVSDPRTIVEIYEGVCGEKTPSPQIFREYPWYQIDDILHVSEKDKGILYHLASQVRGYISDSQYRQVRDAISEIPETYPAPQFRVPEYQQEPDYSKVCNRCKHEGECFTKKAKRISDMLSWKRYAKEELGFEENDLDVILGVFDEVKGYLPRTRYPIGQKGIKGLKLFNIEEKRVTKLEEDNPSSTSSFDIIKINIDGEEVSLYAKGNLDALKMQKVSISGGRTVSQETKEFIYNKVDEFKNYAIVSGLALGCDTIAHEKCLENNGTAIVVLPCGFNKISPKSNRKLANKIIKEGGLILSEYEPNTKVHKKGGEWSYTRRNRIITGISDKVIICKGGNGTYNTKQWAKRQGKEILVQPSSFKEEKNTPQKKDWHKYLEEFDKNYKCSIPENKLEKLQRIGDTQRKLHSLNKRYGREEAEELEKNGYFISFLEYWIAKRNLAITYVLEDVDDLELRLSFDSTTGRGLFIDFDKCYEMRQHIPLSDIFTYRPFMW